MDPKNYSRLATVIFAIIALLQLVHVFLAWEIALNGVPIPLFVSGIAAFLAVMMAWLPANATFGQGAAMNVPYATAYQALFNRAHGQVGETVLVHGASGQSGTQAALYARL